MSGFLPYEKYTLTTHLQAFELYNRHEILLQARQKKILKPEYPSHFPVS